jgi:hypothetical protein
MYQTLHLRHVFYTAGLIPCAPEVLCDRAPLDLCITGAVQLFGIGRSQRAPTDWRNWYESKNRHSARGNCSKTHSKGWTANARFFDALTRVTLRTIERPVCLHPLCNPSGYKPTTFK